jgi:phosphate transport system permease protein
MDVVANAGAIRMSTAGNSESLSQALGQSEKEARYRRRRGQLSQLFAIVCGLSTWLCVAVLIALLWNIFSNGIPWLSWHFLTDLPSRIPERAGIQSALIGSLWLIGLTTLFSVPIGVGSAIYLEEYGRSGWWRKLVQLNIANLAGVPSIVYGILGLGLFVRALALERSIWAGSLTLTIVVLPIVILASQEALRAVPGSIRHASYALGATRWQTIWYQVLPAATPGIMTGVILSISRALGEAAPLVVIGAATFTTFVPSSPSDEFSALPLQIYSWAARPKAEFHELAAAGIIVLLVVLLILNAGAVFVRYRFGKRLRW